MSFESTQELRTFLDKLEAEREDISKKLFQGIDTYNKVISQNSSEMIES